MPESIDMTTPTSLPYGEAFEQFREVLEALPPDLQPVFLDYLSAGKGAHAMAKELALETGIRFADDEVGRLRREVLEADRNHDPMRALAADEALLDLGHGLDMSRLLAALKPLLPIALQMRWISPTDGEPSPSNEGGAGGPSA